MPNTIRFLTLALLFLSLSCAQQQGEFTGRHITPASVRIGTWDLRYLGPSAHNRNESRSPDDIAAYIAQSGASVLALTSVGETPGSADHNATLDRAFELLRLQGQGDWQYLLFPNQDPQHANGTAVAWNRNLIGKIDDAWALPIDQGQVSPSDGTLILDRVPHAVHFSTGDNGVDFVVVPISLQGDLGPGDHVAHRVTEATILAQKLPSIREHAGSPNLILAGDFGMPRITETTHRLLTDAGLRDLNASDLPSKLNGVSDDRVFVPASGPVFSGVHGLEQVTMPGFSDEQFRRRLSDHFMMVFTLRQPR